MPPEERTNQFSWSKSRSDDFKACLRRYYLHYYGSWAGWREDAPNHEIYIMKNLKTIPLWVGSVVHETIRWVLRNSRTPTRVYLDDAKQRLYKYMDYDWFTSCTGYFRDDPQLAVGLREHYYGEPLSQNDFDAAYTHASHCVENFYRRSLYPELLVDSDVEMLQIEQLDATTVSRTNVWVVADLILKWNGWIYIADWKTGKNLADGDTELQLPIYALYASRKWNVAPEEIMVNQTNLFHGEQEITEMTFERTIAAERQIAKSIQEMKSRLAEPRSNTAREEDFPKTENTLECRTCNFINACA